MDPAKPLERKSVLNQKLGQTPKVPLPPIAKKDQLPPADSEKAAKKAASKSGGQAFQIVFDDYSDQLKTKKYSKFSSLVKNDPKLPRQTINPRYN